MEIQRQQLYAHQDLLSWSGANGTKSVVDLATKYVMLHHMTYGYSVSHHLEPETSRGGYMTSAEDEFRKDLAIVASELGLNPTYFMSSEDRQRFEKLQARDLKKKKKKARKKAVITITEQAPTLSSS